MLALSEEITDPLLGGVDILGELPDPDVPWRVRLVAPLWPPQAPVVVDPVGRDELALLGHDVGRHRVVDPAGLPQIGSPDAFVILKMFSPIALNPAGFTNL